jgi:hypothetical protein
MSPRLTVTIIRHLHAVAARIADHPLSKLWAQPKVAIPMNVGEGIGSLADAARFKEKATVPVIVLPIEK